MSRNIYGINLDQHFPNFFMLRSTKNLLKNLRYTSWKIKFILWNFILLTNVMIAPVFENK